MFLYVNIGPRWTLGGRCSFGYRGYLTECSKRRPSSSTSVPVLGSRRFRHSPSIFSASDRQRLQDATPPLKLWRAKASQSPAVSHDQAACLTTSASHGDNARTDLDAGDASSSRFVSTEPFEQRILLADSEDVVLQTALGEREGVDEKSGWVQNCNKPSDQVTESLPPLMSDCQDGAIVSGENLTEWESQMNRPISFDTRQRQLPDLFELELTRLGTLLTEKRGIEKIRDAFSHAISEKDRLWRLHGLDIYGWLNGPWDSDKAMQVVQLLLGSIVSSPHQVVEILQHMEEVEDDFVVRCRCLSFTGFLYKDVLNMHSGLMAKFESEVKKLWVPHLWPVTEMRRRHLSLLLWRTSGEEAQKLIEVFLQKYPAASVNTRLHLAMYCSRNEMSPLALSILTNLPPEELQSPGTWTLRCCAVLLRHDEVEATPDGLNFKFLPRLLEKGLTPDNMLYARIIERALESGYPGVAWDVYRHLQASKIEVTAWTYLLLLRHAFSENNVAGVQELMLEIQNNEALYSNVYLLTYSMNIIRRIFHHEKEMTTAESLSHMLALYDRVFSRDVLVKLGVVPSVVSTKSKMASGESEATNGVVEPDAYCLSFTIWTFVLCNRSSRDVRRLWARIRELVEAGDTQIVECMRLDMIYNAFIWLNLRDKRAQNMTTALEILQYMLTKQLCQPTDRTWSILICGFLRNDQHAQAKHIYGLMRQCDLSMEDIRKEYWRTNWSFEYLKAHIAETLDESKMPDGTEIGAAEVMRFQCHEHSQRDVKEEFSVELQPSI